MISNMADYGSSNDYRAWTFTLASAMACVFGAGLIFIDTIATKILGHEVRMLQNHKFLAGSLGLGSGVMIFSSFYNILPEAKEQLSSDLSIFNRHADAALMVFFFAGVGSMGLIHWIMHRFDSKAQSTGVENSEAIDQFIQRETSQKSQQGQHHIASKAHHTPVSTNRAPPRAGTISTVPVPVSHDCKGCAPYSSDDEEDSYNDSEYVDDEVASLLNNAFLQIGRTPNSCMDDEVYDHSYDDNIEVVITDRKDRALRRPIDRTSNEVDVDVDQSQGNHTDQRKDSWSSTSTRSLKPFAPGNKKKRSSNVSKVNEPRHSSNCPLAHVRAKSDSPTGKPSGDLRSSYHQPQINGVNTLSTYGTISPSANHHHNHPPPPAFPRPELETLRRTSFPRLKGSGIIYSRHDNLDHTVADDREHADLTEIGIQTALTIAIHKFPEGLIMFLSTTSDPCLGLSVFMAIAVHNLIEGYLIAFPLFIGLNSRSRAFALAAVLGGFSQPLGALLGWLILRKVTSMGWQVSATGCIYAMVAGMMSSIAVNGMWPQAVKCVGRNPTKVVQYCFFTGIAIMGICQTVMGTKCNF